MKKAAFDWDDSKNEINYKKHGVTFQEAQYAFIDRNRILAEDIEHSSNEKR